MTKKLAGKDTERNAFHLKDKLEKDLRTPAILEVTIHRQDTV